MCYNHAQTCEKHIETYLNHLFFCEESVEKSGNFRKILFLHLITQKFERHLINNGFCEPHQTGAEPVLLSAVQVDEGTKTEAICFS